MVRITQMSEESHTVHLKVEGRLVGDWVPELDELCGSCLSRKNNLILLDLSEVTFIDRLGIKMLKKTLGERVRIIKASLLVRALLGCEPAREVSDEAQGLG